MPSVSSAPSPIIPGTTYSVDYRARFKRIIDDGCAGPTSDTAVITCETGSMQVLGTSDPTISCANPEPLSSGGQRASCTTSCQGEQCDAIYIDREASIESGEVVHNAMLFAEIDYRCSSMDVNSVEGAFAVIDPGQNGTCTGEGTGSGQNLLFGELNVLCKDEFVNDDAYAECGEGSFNINDRYTCVRGETCSAACQVSYGDIIINTDPYRFRQCINTDDPNAGVPKPMPFETEQAEGVYSAQFRVGSGFWYEDANCQGAKTGVMVECINGTIELVSSNLDKECSVTGANTIECRELETSVVNQYVDVVEYVSLVCLSNAV